MARTKQTARRSTGGMAPRRQIASSYAYNTSSSSPFAGSSQVSILEKTGKRTIAVEGTAEFLQVPDIVHLSFLINETGSTLEEGIQAVLNKIAVVRNIAVQECGLPNERISSDSIGSKAKKIEIGYYTENENGDDDFRVTETKIEYEVKSVVRLMLRGAADVAQFSKLFYQILTRASLRTHEAPTYEIDAISDLRNTARTEACENAKAKATSILEALGDDTIRLGAPLCLNDIFVDLADDAQDSFLGNSWASWETTRQVIPRPPLDSNNNNTSDDGEDDVNMDLEPEAKKAKTGDKEEDNNNNDNNNDKSEAMTSPLDDAEIDKIFVVPYIKIAARIEAVFEIVQVDGEGNSKESHEGDSKINQQES